MTCALASENTELILKLSATTQVNVPNSIVGKSFENWVFVLEEYVEKLSENLSFDV